MVRVPMAASAEAARICWNAGRTVAALGDGGADGAPVAGGAVVIVTPPVAGSTYMVWAVGRWRTIIATAAADTPTVVTIRAAAIAFVIADAAASPPAPAAAPPVATRPAASTVLATRSAGGVRTPLSRMSAASPAALATTTPRRASDCRMWSSARWTRCRAAAGVTPRAAPTCSYELRRR